MVVASAPPPAIALCCCRSARERASHLLHRHHGRQQDGLDAADERHGLPVCLRDAGGRKAAAGGDVSAQRRRRAAASSLGGASAAPFLGAAVCSCPRPAWPSRGRRLPWKPRQGEVGALEEAGSVWGAGRAGEGCWAVRCGRESRLGRVGWEASECWRTARRAHLGGRPQRSCQLTAQLLPELDTSCDHVALLASQCCSQAGSHALSTSRIWLEEERNVDSRPPPLDQPPSNLRRARASFSHQAARPDVLRKCGIKTQPHGRRFLCSWKTHTGAGDRPVDASDGWPGAGAAAATAAAAREAAVAAGQEPCRLHSSTCTQGVLQAGWKRLKLPRRWPRWRVALVPPAARCTTRPPPSSFCPAAACCSPTTPPASPHSQHEVGILPGPGGRRAAACGRRLCGERACLAWLRPTGTQGGPQLKQGSPRHACDQAVASAGGPPGA